MSSNYSGNPSITQVPCAAPAPGAIPTVVLPSDGDPDNAASVAQALKIPADFIAFLQSCARFDTPALPATGSGYTTVTTANGWTGTVVPSGSVKIAAGVRFVIRIDSGGVVGASLFKTSMDGGNTYGSLQTTSASMVCATSGVTLSFSGVVTTGGTASFRSGYTPQAQWSDSAGNGRFLLDHNGLPTGGRISQFREQLENLTFWTAAGGAGSSVTYNNPNNPYPARYMSITPSSTSGLLSVYSTQTQIDTNFTGLTAVLEFEWGLNAASCGTTSNVTWFAGLTNTTDPSTDVRLITLRKKYNATNYDLVTGAGAIQLFQATSPATAPTASSLPVDRVRIEVQGSASPYGAYQARFFVNEALIGAVAAANLPSTTLRLLFGSYNEGGAPSGGPSAALGNPVLTWNRYTAGVTF